MSPPSALYIAISITLIEQMKKNHEMTDPPNVLLFIKEFGKMVKKLPKSNRDEGVTALITNLKELSKGPDGLIGTSDDFIDSKIINDLKTLNETNMLDDLVRLFTKPKIGKMTKLVMLYKYCFVCLNKNH
jgi:hypothetical protein